MIQLPRCPYCGMFFRYRQVSAGRMLGQKTCPHCHQSFLASLSLVTWLMALLLFSGAVAMNILMLRVMNANGWVVLFISLIMTLIYYLLLPLSVRYKGEEGQIFSPAERSMLGKVPGKQDDNQKPKANKMSRSVRVRRMKEQQRRDREKG